MKRRNRTLWIAAAMLFVAFALATETQAGWPLGRPHSHVPSSYRGYRVAPTYSYMPSAYPYGRFGAQSYTPRVVHYDHNYSLRTWGPWPGH